MAQGADLNKAIDAEISRTNRLAQRLESAAKTRKTGARNASEVPGAAPHVRKGEDPLGSRGFMFSRLICALASGKEADWEDAKVERDVCQRFNKATRDHTYGKVQASVVAPFATQFFSANSTDNRLMAEVRQLVKAGVGGSVDQDEMSWISRKSGPEYARKAQSWVDESAGGTLVGPAEYGELIDLFRNKDALINAGATVIPLPPTGRIKYPRQTTATTANWLGESAPATDTQIGTGDLTLSAKKIIGIVKFPNELLRYATVAAEALVRLDLSKTLSLTMDQALLEGAGGDIRPLGLLNTPGINTVTPTTVATNGDTISPQDIYSFTSSIEAANAEMESFIMRPEMFYQFVKARAGVYNGSAVVGSGQFTFDQFREMAKGFGKQLGGFPVVTTPQVSQSRVKGSGTNLTYIVGGMFSDFVIAMFGGIEFMTSDQGYDLMSNDQTAVRAILSCDGGPKHPGAFAVCDSLLMSSIGV